MNSELGRPQTFVEHFKTEAHENFSALLLMLQNPGSIVPALRDFIKDTLSRSKN